MQGTYSKVSDLVSGNGNSVYFIAQDQFWYAEDPINVAPFRAWFETGSSLSAPKLRIYVEDETESIRTVEQEKSLNEVVFDLMGRRNDRIGKGLVIKNGRVFFEK